MKVYESCKAHADYKDYQAWVRDGAVPDKAAAAEKRNGASPWK